MSGLCCSVESMNELCSCLTTRWRQRSLLGLSVIAHWTFTEYTKCHWQKQNNKLKLRALTSDLTTWTVGSQLCVLCYYIYSCLKVSQLQIFFSPVAWWLLLGGCGRWVGVADLHHPPCWPIPPSDIPSSITLPGTLKRPLSISYGYVCLCGRAHCP